jgi:hypothetical protein
MLKSMHESDSGKIDEMLAKIRPYCPVEAEKQTDILKKEPEGCLGERRGKSF